LVVRVGPHGVRFDGYTSYPKLRHLARLLRLDPFRHDAVAAVLWAELLLYVGGILCLFTKHSG
jgi:hypothetical protein